MNKGLSKNIYIDKNGTLWLAHAPGSGSMTWNYLNDKKLRYVANYKDQTFGPYMPDFCKTFVEIAKNMKPLKTKWDDHSQTEVRLYQIPVYDKEVIEHNQYDVWGTGMHPTIKPKKYVYISYSLFDNRKKIIIGLWPTLREADLFHEFKHYPKAK